MTEDPTITRDSLEAWRREALKEIEAAQGAGAVDAGAIAESLNRSGFATWRGLQWDAETVLEFLADPEVERIRRDEMGRTP